MDTYDETPRTYSIHEILSGMIRVVLCIFILQIFLDVFVNNITYDNYCCCNLELKDDPTKTLNFDKTNVFNQNAFCIHYNQTRHSTRIFWENKDVETVVYKFRQQLNFNPDEFRLYLSLKNLPLYIIPNIHCNSMLKKLNVKETNMEYGCIDINVMDTNPLTLNY